MKRFQISPDSSLKLDNFDPNDTSFFNGKKSEAEKELLKLNSRLADLQQLLFAEHHHKVLIVLQAMDTGGKDGTIRKIFSGINPQGVKVANFKAPTAEELDHDYLWRIHHKTPAKGELVIFNRSHYEDVLIVRVHSLVKQDIWKQRFEQINNFEKMLSQEGTTILKFFLHIDKNEQKKRLEDRIKEPDKNWKFNSGDLKERTKWDHYTEAYEEAIEKTSTPWAPWHIIPSNHKWFRNFAIASIITAQLEHLEMKYPEPEKGLDSIVIV